MNMFMYWLCCFADSALQYWSCAGVAVWLTILRGLASSMRMSLGPCMKCMLVQSM